MSRLLGLDLQVGGGKSSSSRGPEAGQSCAQAVEKQRTILPPHPAGALPPTQESQPTHSARGASPQITELTLSQPLPQSPQSRLLPPSLRRLSLVGWAKSCSPCLPRRSSKAAVHPPFEPAAGSGSLRMWAGHEGRPLVLVREACCCAMGPVSSLACSTTHKSQGPARPAGGGQLELPGHVFLCGQPRLGAVSPFILG